MPLDPRIPLGGQQQPFNNPFAQIAEMRAQRQQAQAQQQAAQESSQIRQQAIAQNNRQAQTEQRAAESDESYLQIIGNPDLTPEAVGELVRTKTPEKYDAYVAQIDKHAQSAFARKKLRLEAEVLEKAWVGGIIDDIAQADYDPLRTELGLKMIEAEEPQFAEQAAQIRQQILDGGGRPAIKALIDRLRPPAKAAEGFTLGEGQTRFDAAGQPIAQGEAKPEVAQSLDAMLAAAVKAKDGPETRRLLNAMGQKNAAGRAPTTSATPGPLEKIIGPDGKAVYVTRDQAIGKAPASGTEKASSGVQKRVLNFFNRARQADEELEGMEKQISELSLAGQVRLDRFPNFAQSQLGQSYGAAQRAFTEARLRKDSGAAIPEQEFTNDKKTYFQETGDSPETLAQKRRARAAILSSLGFESGQALGEFLGDPDEAKSIVEGYKTRSSKTGAGVPRGTAAPDAASKAAALIKKYGG